MVGLVLMSLALGISFTVGLVAVLAIAARRGLGAVFSQRLSDMERWARIVQGTAGALIVAIGVYTLARLAA
jgi:cytochrome c biogenesis protein CcdA